MFQHVFDEMNNMLDEIVKHYPSAHGPKKQALVHNWNMLKSMSEGIIDEWLHFEEKMALFRESAVAAPIFPLTESPELQLDSFIRGQGYYKLLMFRPAINQFATAASVYPDSLLIRLYKAMAHLHLGETEEASGYLTSILPLVDDKRFLQAMIYNALGCIQVINGRTEHARDYFTLAIQSDPTLPDPLNNLEVCHKNRGQLQYGSQLISLL
ncbi:tetratricopeptide repeat protein [Paenibacillus sp. GCM10028914]|uniref:tetratricopeptide repeat protein n=1 Tax=Paenibacillus sp. GCM10028914 TaxID=3273416 RepID=UPI0036086C0D